jgi:hypothetical protein
MVKGFTNNTKPFLIQMNQAKHQQHNTQGSDPSSIIDLSITDEGIYKRSGKWTREEDELLVNAVSSYGTKNWKLVAKAVFGRNQVQCLHRWTKILQPGLTKGPWSIEEDRKLMQWVKKEGPNKWTSCAEYINGRSGKQCRERWLNTLNPDVKKGNWEPEEDYMIFKLFTQFGSQWSKINLYFQNRTENSIKNRFYSTLRRIAAEKRKDMNTIEPSSSAKIKLDSLLQYVPEAMNEKATKLMKKNGGQELPAVSETSVNSKETYETSVINMPVFKDEKVVQDIYMSANHSEEDSRREEYCFFSDEKIGYLDNEINNFLDIIESSSNDQHCSLNFLHQEDENVNIINNNVNINDNNLTSMVQQLSTLEELLESTRRQILTEKVNN